MRARPVSLNAAEVALLRSVLGGEVSTAVTRRLLAKLDRATEERAGGTAVGPIEEALVAHSRGRVVPLASGPSGYSRATKLATGVQATPVQAMHVGAWLSRQGWFNGTTTILGVLKKWDEWLPRALAEVGGEAREEGFHDATGDAPGRDAPAGPGGGGRGKAEGFR